MERQKNCRPPFRKRIATIGLLLVTATIVVCSAILEIGLRTIGRLPSNTTDGIYRQVGNSYRLKKNLKKEIKIPSFSCTIYTNSLGFRDKISGNRTIGPDPYYVFLGESLTFGHGVDYERTFAGLTAQKMAPERISIVNLAMAGHLFLEQAETFREFLDSVDFSPSKVLICFSPSWTNGFDVPHSNIIIKSGYLFPKESWLLPYIRITLGNVSAAYCYFRDNIRRIQGRLFNMDRANYRKALSFFLKSHRLSDPDIIEKFEQALENINKLIYGVGASPVYIYLPLSTDLRASLFLKQTGEDPDDFDFSLHSDLLKKYCQKNGIPFLDLYPVLDTLHKSGIKLDFSQDLHYNEIAHEAIGDAIIEFLSSHTMISPMAAR